MKKLIAVSLATLALAGCAKSVRTINEPAYEARQSGILQVERIERADSATRITYSLNYRPRWWVKVEATGIALTDTLSGLRLLPTKLEGYTFGEKVFMPADGDTSFVAVYPPIPRSVSKVDIGLGDSWPIHGVDLTGKTKRRKPVTPKLTAGTPKPFEGDSATVSGRIHGLAPQCGIKTLTLWIFDPVTGKSFPRVINVNPDGTFSRRIPVPVAQKVSIDLPTKEGTSIPAFIAPGNDLTVEFDWETLIGARDGIGGIPSAITYGGNLATLNRELADAPRAHGLQSWRFEGITPQEAKDSVMRFYDRELARVEEYIATLPAGSAAPALLRAEALADRGGSLLDYAEFNESHGLLPVSWYEDFISELLMADSTMLMIRPQLLLNRMGFSNMQPSRRRTFDRKSFRETVEMLVDSGAVIPDETMQLVNRITGNDIDEVAIQDLYHLYGTIIPEVKRLGLEKEFTEKSSVSASDPFSFVTEKWLAQGATDDRNFIKRLAGTEDLPLIWQYAICEMSHEGIISAPTMDLDNLGITDPKLRARLQADREALQNRGPRFLPNTPGGALMAQLIEPYRGKYLLVDFWDIFCGPCRAGIEDSEEFRAKHAGAAGFDFLFLASEKGSPEQRYLKYVDEHLKGEDVKRLPEVQMDMLRELFEFNAIPRYVLFSPDGEILNDNFSHHDFQHLLQEKGLLPATNQ